VRNASAAPFVGITSRSVRRQAKLAGPVKLLDRFVLAARVLLMSFDQTGGSSPDDPVSQAVANWRLHDMSPNPFSLRPLPQVLPLHHLVDQQH
jgi:hypothetical protein